MDKTEKSAIADLEVGNSRDHLSDDVPAPVRAKRRTPPTSEQIAVRVCEMGREMSRDLAGSRPPVLIGVLKGAVVFLADLSRSLDIPHEIDFVICSSYGDRTTS